MSEDLKRQLYNRQEYVVGAEAQKKYGQTDVLVVGMTGLGCEIAKNLILTGVRSVTLCDDAAITVADLSSLFYATEADIGKPRAATVVARLGELNRLVRVELAPEATGNRVAALEQWRSRDSDGIKVVIFVDHLTTKLIKENEWARGHGVKFVACESRGISGCVFVDGGEEFTILDKNGEENVSVIVTAITEDGVIMCHEDKKHECEPGDKVYFTGIVGPDVNSPEGGKQLRLFEVVDVMGPFILKVKDVNGDIARGAKAFEAVGGYMHTTKQPSIVRFKALHDAIAQPEMMFISDDDPKVFAAYELHKIFQAVHTQLQAGSGEALSQRLLPQDVSRLVAELTAGDEAIANKVFVEQAVSTFHGNLNAMACFVGGLASQEALKLCSGKFTPLFQWMYYDVREIMEHAGRDTEPTGSRYDGQIAVIGRKAQEAVQRASGFVVGAGALGCEFIKNFAMMGVATEEGAAVHITDMDTIEMSNLSRQFLFRAEHIGHPKSRVAADAARGMNPAMKLVHYEEKVAAETVSTFSSDFWESQTFVCTALDNMQARKYVDEQCVFFKRPLFDSGTLGTKCSVQVVVPFVTQSYSSSYDPPESTIPICTLKNFPNAIEHTIQWARDHFFSLFTQQPRDANSYIHDDGFLASLDKEPGNKPIVFASLVNIIGKRPTSAEDCVRWARVKFEDLFVNNVKQLLHAFPKDKVNDKGERFWSGAKKPPTPSEFNPGNSDHVSFIVSAAKLYAEVHGMTITLPVGEQMRIAAETPAPAFQPKAVKFADNEKEKSDNAEAQMVGEIGVNDLPARAANAGLRFGVVEFEKDDDANMHMDFITAASNIRATVYRIPTADKFRTKMIAGQIIPAMVTTTSLVTGLVMFELIKYLLGERRIELFRNSYTNIALPLLTLTWPQQIAGVKHKKRDGSEIEWNMWSRIDIDEGRDITIKELVHVLERDHDIETSMITAENGKILFSEFNQKPEKVGQKVSAALENMGCALPQSQKHLCVVVTGSVADEDVDIPLVRYRFRF